MEARADRRHFLLSTATLFTALTAYGGRANAACSGPPANIVCSGSNVVSQDIAASDANITTVPGFSVDTPAGSAVTVSGDGAFFYTDENASPLTSNAADTDALFVQSEADIMGGNEGSVTINTNGVLNGARDGLVARNYGSGSISVTADGNVTGGVAGRGIYAASGSDQNPAGRDIVVTTGANATVNSGRQAIRVNNRGTGITRIIANGNVTSTYSDAINASGGTSIEVTTAAGSTINGDQYGIAVGGAGGSITIVANGIVTSGELDGISTEITTGDGDIDITTGAGSSVIGTYRGLNARTYSAGAVNITVNGDVTGNTSDGIFSRHYYGGDINIEVGANSDVSADNGFAVNTYGSTTLIVAGRLSGDSGAVEFDQGESLDDRVELRPTAEVNGDVLAGPGTDTLAFAGAGDGAFDLSNIDTGGGTEQFQDFERFVVESATWTMNGVTSADFLVEGGTVKGNGTFGSLTVTGGTLSPGNSFGTVTVNGAFSLGPGAVLEVEVDANGNGDQVVVNGTVNLTGSVLRILAVDGEYKAKTEYVIIDNDGVDPVVGEFASITSNLAFLVPTVIYDGGTGNDVVLSLERVFGPDGTPLSFCSVAETRNQCSVGEALDRFPTDNALFLAVLNQTAAGARAALDALSGEIHATVAGTLIDDNRYAREAVLGRMMQASHHGQALGNGGPDVASYDDSAMRLGGVYDGKSLAAVPQVPPLAFWTQAYGAWGTFDGDGNAATANRNLGGFISGMDADVWNGWRIGVATGASFSDVSVDRRHSGANTKTYHLGGYANGEVSGFALRAGGLWAWSEIETSRAVVFPRFYERQKADYDADTGQLFGEIAYPTRVAGIELEPFGGLAYVSLEGEGFREKGGPEASLRTSGIDQDVGYTAVGLRAARTMLWGNMEVTPRVEAAWLHAFDDVTPGASLVFATTGIGFDVDGVPLAEDSALLDVGVDFALSDRLSAGASYSGQYADDVSDNAVKGRLTWLF